jgi:hypothetical protein
MSGVINVSAVERMMVVSMRNVIVLEAGQNFSFPS